ncbi:MAG: patatin-like phospholipase family protein [Alphaproteobacteria bacterium]|nr:patatin-like phospholipase family protein [Alphaproteobacteria bacterium]
MSNTNEHNPQKTTIALFTYGGGMRGLIPAHIMSRIEDKTGLRMADMVDIFTGPSTGAILNAAMTLRHPEHTSSPRFRARHMVKFYEREGHKIFPADRFREFRGIVHDFNNRTLKLNQLNWLFRHGHYDPSNLGRALKALYGQARLSESLRTLVIPTYNLDGEQLRVLETDEGGGHDWVARGRASLDDYGGHALWMSNIRHIAQGGPSLRTPDVSLYDAVMASCAAPTYFPCHHFKARYPGKKEISYTGIDGCVFDNPCVSYLGSIRKMVPAENKLVMLVLGTGYTNKAIKKDDWNSYGALGVVDPVNDLPLINIFFHAAESALMESFVDDLGRDLYVFNSSILPESGRTDIPSPQIDDASPENLEKMRLFSETLMEENSGQMDDICHILASNRDRREEERRQSSIGDRVKKYFTFFGERETVE